MDENLDDKQIPKYGSQQQIRQQNDNNNIQFQSGQHLQQTNIKNPLIFTQYSERMNMQSPHNQSIQKDSSLKKTKTFISTSVVDKKQAKHFFGKAFSIDRAAMSSYSSFKPPKEFEEFEFEKTLSQKILLWIKKHIILSPTSLFRLIWDFLTIIFILYTCFYNAFKGYFLLDFVSTFPWQILNKNITVVKLLRMLRLPRFLKLIKEDRFISIVNAILKYTDTQDKVKTQFIFRYIYRNIQFILTGLSLAYFVSCFWYYLLESINEKNLKGNNFISTYGINYMPDWKKAVINCYFVLTTFSTVGFGDVTPISNTERIVVIIMMVCGIAFFSYIMNNFNDVLTNYWKKLGYVDKRVEIEEWILSLSNYTDRTIDKKLVNQIQNHFEYFFKHSRLSVISQKDKYFQLMPDDLKKDMIKHLFQDIFYTKFRSLFQIQGKYECSDYGFYIDTAFALIPMKYVTGETICKQGDKVSEVYLVLEGEIEASFTLDDVKVSRFFSTGFYFGAINILSNKLCRVDYKAAKNSKLLVWDRSSFIEILNRYDEIKEHIISVSFQSFKTTKNAMIQAMIAAIKMKKGILLNEESANRVFRNMIRYISILKRKQQCLSDIGTQTSHLNTLEKDLSQVEKKLSKVTNYINLMDQSIAERRTKKIITEQTQQQQLKNLIRDLDKQN